MPPETPEMQPQHVHRALPPADINQPVEYADEIPASPLPKRGGRRKSLIIPMRLEMRGTLTTFRESAERTEKEREKLKIDEYQDRAISGAQRDRRRSLEQSQEDGSLAEIQQLNAMIRPKSANRKLKSKEPDSSAATTASTGRKRPVSAAAGTQSFTGTFKEWEAQKKRTTLSRKSTRKKVTERYPTTAELARFSMYLSTHQHWRLKSHIQKIERSDPPEDSRARTAPSESSERPARYLRGVAV